MPYAASSEQRTGSSECLDECTQPRLSQISGSLRLAGIFNLLNVHHLGLARKSIFYILLRHIKVLLKPSEAFSDKQEVHLLKRLTASLRA